MIVFPFADGHVEIWFYFSANEYPKLLVLLIAADCTINGNTQCALDSLVQFTVHDNRD